MWHAEQCAKARPRNIAAFDSAFTVAGAYFARLCIKIVKRWQPGFVSGYNLQDLGDKISTAAHFADIHQPSWFMADGSSWDAH